MYKHPSSNDTLMVKVSYIEFETDFKFHIYVGVSVEDLCLT